MKIIRNMALGALIGFSILPLFGIAYDIAYPVYQWIFPSLESYDIHFLMIYSLILAVVGIGVAASVFSGEGKE